MPPLTPEQLAERRRFNRRILLLVGGIGAVFLVWAGFYQHIMWVLGAVFLCFAVVAFFATASDVKE